MWKGAIQFGLITIPVKMYLATESKGVSFNMLHGECHGRIQMKTYCPTDEVYIERGDTVRGYEVAPGQYVVVTDEDLAAVPLKTVRSIEIEQFVPVDSGSETTRFVKQAYYLEPEPVARKAFYLLKQVLAERVCEPSPRSCSGTASSWPRSTRSRQPWSSRLSTGPTRSDRSASWLFRRPRSRSSQPSEPWPTGSSTP